MKTLSQVLHQVLRSLEEKYHQKKTGVPAGADSVPPGVHSTVPPVSQTDGQREVLRQFMHLRGQ